MLEANERQAFLEALRPSVGEVFDFAIGTTFSLDLLSLLTTPVAFTLFEIDDGRDGRPDVERTVHLESLRRYSDRIAIFCQAGQTHVPSRYSPLFTYLEQSIIEVDPPNGGVFHPKVWVLRFKSEDGAFSYRLLSASRNLTFDRSWDVLVGLEGPLRDRQRGFAANKPLGDFLAALPKLAIRGPIPERVTAEIARFAADIRRVEFTPPAPFESFSFWAGGIGDSREWPFPKGPDRALIVSPFLSASTLNRIVDDADTSVLVSTAQSLQDVGPKGLRSFETVHVLTDLADADPTDEDSSASAEELSGLHAKLYVFDQGWNARLWTGSANATEAAFSKNIEFLVGFTGKKSACGVDVVLGPRQGATTLADLLVEYRFDSNAATAATKDEDTLLEEARGRLVKAGLRVVVESSGEAGPFFLRLSTSSGDVNFPAGPVEVRCRPLGVDSSRAVVISAASTDPRFGPLAIDGITSFFAFELSTGTGSNKKGASFVLNLPLEGAPSDRRERLLRWVLRDADGVARFILLLLAPDDADASFTDSILPSSSNGDSISNAGTSPQLFEQLVHALHRTPERLDAVARLVEELQKDPERGTLFPKDFELVWKPIWEARQGIRK